MQVGFQLPYIPKIWSGWPESNRSSRVWKTPTLPLSYSRESWSGQRESNPRHPRWRRGILPLNYDRPNLVEAEGDDPSLPVCRTGVLPIRRRPQIWCPVRLGIPGPLVCRTSAHNPSELTGQILVGVEELESSTRRVRAGYVATNTSLPKTGASAGNRTQVGRLPSDCSATELHQHGSPGRI